MKTFKIVLSLALVVILGGAVTAYVKAVQSHEPAAVPAVPQSLPIELVSAQRFTLETPYTHWWRVEQPKFNDGWLLVLRADVELLRPRQAREPVLVVGDETAERVNIGHASGHLIAFVPGDVELTGARIFFAPPDLPEELSKSDVAGLAAEAVTLDVPAVDEGRVAAALGTPLAFRSDHELRVHAADLIEKFAPDEVDLVRGLRVPLVR